MKLFVCSVLDKGAAIFSPPMFVRHVQEAKRSVQQAARDPKTMLAQYPEQYSLWCIGQFDDGTGEIITGKHELLAQVASLIPAEQK